MITLEIAIQQLNACARIYGGTWYLAATWIGYLRTTNKAEAEMYGILHTAG